MRSVTGVSLLLAALVCSGCSGEGQQPEAETELSSEKSAKVLESLERDLSVGASGIEVRALHSYLTRFGYFPNADLAQQFPAWRPLVAEAPPRHDAFGEATADAVRAFQRIHGLNETGVVDPAVRKLLRAPRCAVPDGIDALDPANKFALLGSIWGRANLTWKLINTDDGLSRATIEASIAAALSSWSAPTGMTFTKTTGAADIEVRFADLQNANLLGDATEPSDGGDVRLNTTVTWSTTSPSPAGTTDLQSIVLHELGHAIGMHHSGYGHAVMFGSYPGGIHRTLSSDDYVGAKTIHVQWQMFDSSDLDVDVDTGPRFHKTYVLSAPRIPGGGTPWVLTNGTWASLPGQGGVRIAAKAGTVWIVSDSGNIYQWNGSAWAERPGCAKDIAVGPDGSVWVIGCGAITNGFADGFAIYKWNGSGWDEDRRAGRGVTRVGGVRITVGGWYPGSESWLPNGAPWIVTANNAIFRSDRNSTTDGSWFLVTGLATDIAASANGYAWSVGTQTVTGGKNIQVFNENPPADGSPPSPARLDWITVPGGAESIAVDPTGSPYVVSSRGEAFSSL